MKYYTKTVFTTDPSFNLADSINSETMDDSSELVDIIQMNSQLILLFSTQSITQPIQPPNKKVKPK